MQLSRFFTSVIKLIVTIHNCNNYNS